MLFALSLAHSMRTEPPLSSRDLSGEIKWLIPLIRIIAEGSLKWAVCVVRVTCIPADDKLQLCKLLSLRFIQNYQRWCEDPLYHEQNTALKNVFRTLPGVVDSETNLRINNEEL